MFSKMRLECGTLLRGQINAHMDRLTLDVFDIARKVSERIVCKDAGNNVWRVATPLTHQMLQAHPVFR